MSPDKQIKLLLDGLNQQKMAGTIITRNLTDNILLAKIWDAPVTEDSIAEPLTAYLIQSDNCFVGCATTFENELYAFMLPTYRRKRIMGSALSGTILPHLLQQQPILRIRINKSVMGNEKKFYTAKKLALTSGFSLLGQDGTHCRMVMDASSLKERIFIKGFNIKLTDERKTALQKKLNYAGALLSIVQTELEYTCGIAAYSEELSDLIQLLGKHADILDNAWFDK